MNIVNWFKSRRELLRMVESAQAERDAAIATLKYQELNHLLISIENDALKRKEKNHVR